MNLMYSMLLASTISTLLLCVSLLMTTSMVTREKRTPFECGFDPKTSARLPFSLRFFLLAIIFIVFDIEIILLMPIPALKWTYASSTMNLTMLVFILILILGLAHEWNEGSLNWSA